MAGPLACGMAVALRAVQTAQLAADDGLQPALDSVERGHLIALCAVSAQLLGDATMEACNALIASQEPISARTAIAREFKQCDPCAKLGEEFTCPDCPGVK